ncbi:MAG: hypothetical protein RL769_436 [Pseudomonadota bacterium]
MHNPKSSSPNSPKTPPLLGRDEDLPRTPPANQYQEPPRTPPTNEYQEPPRTPKTDEYRASEVLSFPTTPDYVEGEGRLERSTIAPDNTPTDGLPRQIPHHVAFGAFKRALNDEIEHPKESNDSTVFYKIPDHNNNSAFKNRRVLKPLHLTPFAEMGAYNQLFEWNILDDQAQGGNTPTQPQTYDLDSPQIHIPIQNNALDLPPSGVTENSERTPSPRTINPSSPKTQFKFLGDNRKK